MYGKEQSQMSSPFRIRDAIEATDAYKKLTPEDWQSLRKKAQEKVMANISKDLLGKYRDPEAKKQVSFQVLQVVENEYPGLQYHAKLSVVERLTSDISGYGPLEALLDNKEITEILVEQFDKVVIEKNGILEETEIKFDSEEHLRLVIERIIIPLGRELNWTNPIVDGRLPDRSRVCVVIPPVAVNGAQIAIRKFKPNVSMSDLVKWGALPEELAESIQSCVTARLSTFISGGTGSGKSTFLNACSEFIPQHLSIITIENPTELQLKHPRVRQWEARPANMEGKGEVTMMALVIAALRSRPDVIIVGEVRGKEAFALMQALNTGHDGSMSTGHANSPEDMMKRLVSMVASAGELAPDLVPSYVAGNVDLVFQLARRPDGSRKLVEVAELIGEKNGAIILNPLVKYAVDKAYSADSKEEGYWELTGNQFTRLCRLRDKGVPFKGWLGGKDKAYALAGD
jgi:pilus assembly protein CpaF